MILNEPFNKESLNTFLKDFLPDYQLDERSVRTPDKSILTEVTQLGASRKAEVTVLEAECEETDTNRRIAITQAAFKVLREHSIRNAIIAFHDGADQWRLSLLTSTLEIKDGKVVKKDSNPRRYSYLLGVGAKTVTPYKYLIEKGKVEDIKQLQERFSVEVVNKQFYASVADLFTKLVGGERGVTKYPGLLKINSVISQNVEHQEFAVRLIGRIIFSWFLKEKRSTAGVAIVPNELLSLDAVASNADYYHSILEPLFFELLNKRVENRHESLRESPFSTVPYLNGGLFSPQRGDFYSQNSFNGAGTPGLTHIPNEWFGELFTVLEQYNFTVDENTSYDVDLSIDPEMLGRIFENLLAEINPETGESARKSTGSFYTPREIVDYMVDNSLLEFLKTKTGTDEKKLKALISWGQADDDEHPLTDSERQKIVTALAKLTILDPACGSGAFPIGILQKVVYILQQADPRAEIWLENQLKNIASPELKRDIQEKYESENYDWLRKYGVIRETIFGIDIQTIATEISKLRCFLTLIIEEEVDDDKLNRGVHALPNLDFKFVTANSLVGLPDSNATSRSKGLNLFEDVSHIEQLKLIRNQYFGANADERNRLQIEFKDLQHEMFRSRLASMGATSDLYNILSDWDPFKHKSTDWFDSEWMFGVDGFDIVIGNPPYVRQELISNKPVLSSAYSGIYDGRADLLVYFFGAGIRHLSSDGILAYISSDKFFIRGYGKKLRAYLKANTQLVNMVKFGELPVFKAAVDSSIIILKNRREIDSKFCFAQAKTKNDIIDINNLVVVSGAMLSQQNLKDDGWTLNSSEALALIEKIIGRHQTLWEYTHGNIFAGVKSGMDGAFVIDEATKNTLVKTDPSSSKLIKPWYKGKDIRRWTADFKGTYVIYVPQNKIDIDDFPAIKSHLAKFRDGLEKRVTKQKWYEMQQPQERFTELFEQKKIIYGEISTEMRACVDDKRSYGTMKMFFMPYDLGIVGLLNSKLFDWFARMTFASLGDPWNGGRLSFNTMYMKTVPVPALLNENDHIQEIVKKLIADKNNGDMESYQSLEVELNHSIYNLFNLTTEEIAIIEESTS